MAGKYYKLITGRIVESRDFRLAFEVLTGLKAVENYTFYRRWKKGVVSTSVTKEYDEITESDILEFVERGHPVIAMWAYSDMKNCSLMDAKKYVDGLRGM